jgi:quercetin dioxygenase-like cupin family protein
MTTEMNPTAGASAGQPALDEVRVLRRVVDGTHQRLDVFGPTVEFLTSPEEAQNDFCVIRGVIPPGVSVPLHAHPGTEDFFVISGEVVALKHGPEGYESIVAKAGDYVHVPSQARHGWRNVSSEPNVALITTTARLGRIFQEIGRPATGAPLPMTPEDVARFVAVAAKYGHWRATPEENAAVGITF